jgi:hypothetical protein
MGAIAVVLLCAISTNPFGTKQERIVEKALRGMQKKSHVSLSPGQTRAMAAGYGRICDLLLARTDRLRSTFYRLQRMRRKELKIMMQEEEHMSKEQMRAIMGEERDKLTPAQLEALGTAYSKMATKGLSTQAVEQDYMTPAQLKAMVDEEALLPASKIAALSADGFVHLEHSAEKRMQNIHPPIPPSTQIVERRHIQQQQPQSLQQIPNGASTPAHAEQSGPQCNPNIGCNVCAGCCQVYIPPGKNCNDCALRECFQSHLQPQGGGLEQEGAVVVAAFKDIVHPYWFTSAWVLPVAAVMSSLCLLCCCIQACKAKLRSIKHTKKRPPRQPGVQKRAQPRLQQEEADHGFELSEYSPGNKDAEEEQEQQEQQEGPGEPELGDELAGYSESASYEPTSYGSTPSMSLEDIYGRGGGNDDNFGSTGAGFGGDSGDISAGWSFEDGPDIMPSSRFAERAAMDTALGR